MSAAPASGLWGWLLELLDDYADDLFLLAVTAVIAIVRASGITVDDGQIGLKFSFGRAARVLAPGFHPLFPFLQTARVLPSRSRTLELPAQRVETRERLVLFADANLVYKVVDVRKALIEIDDLEKGMLQMLGIGVQRVLRSASRAAIADPHALDAALAHELEARLAPWGVTVERAGFKSITPDRATLRVTQLAAVTRERRAVVRLAVGEGHGVRRALALLGTRSVVRSRTRELRSVARRSKRVRALRATLVKSGWTNAQIHRASRRLRERITTGGALAAGVEQVRAPRALGNGKRASTERRTAAAR